MEQETHAQWEKLKAMREAHAEVASEPAAPARAANSVTASPVPPPPPAANPPRSAHAPPALAEIDLDGQKIAVDSSLAKAFQKAEQINTSAAKDTDRDRLKAELREELRTELRAAADGTPTSASPTAPPLPSKPNTSLLLSDPDEWERRQALHEEARVKAAIEQQQFNARKAAEENARGVLREQFYDAYPVLRDSANIVDPILVEQFDAVLASGKVNKPLSPREAEALKKSEFADAAAKATRRVVGIMNAGKKIARPATLAAPTTASATAAPAAAPTRLAAASSLPADSKRPTSREKYPKGSVSAALAERRTQRA